MDILTKAIKEMYSYNQLFSGWEYVKLPENELFVYNPKKNNFDFVKKIEMKAYNYYDDNYYGGYYGYGYGTTAVQGTGKWARCNKCPFYKLGMCTKYDKEYWRIEKCPFAENGYREKSNKFIDKSAPRGTYYRCKDCPYLGQDRMCNRYHKKYWEVTNCPFAINGYQENKYSKRERKFIEKMSHLRAKDAEELYGEDVVENMVKECRNCPYRNKSYCTQMEQLVIDAVENCPYVGGKNDKSAEERQK